MNYRIASLDRHEANNILFQFYHRCLQELPHAQENRFTALRGRLERFFADTLNGQAVQHNMLIGFIIGTLLFLLFSICYFNNSGLQSNNQFDKYGKHVSLWTPEETHDWLSYLGKWSADMVAPVALDNNLSKHNKAFFAIKRSF